MKTESIPVVEIAHLNTIDNNLKNDFIISDTNEDILKIILEHPIKINSIVVGICVQGKGRIQVNLNKFELLENHVFILSPKSIFQCYSEDFSEDFLAKYISFSPEFISEFDISYLYTDLQSTPYLQLLDIKEYQYLLKLYDDLLEKYNRKENLYKRDILKHTLLSAMYEFCIIDNKYYGTDENQNIDRSGQLIRDFYKLLLKNYRQQHNTVFYAEKLFLSPKYLSTTIKNQTGKTVADWIFDFIIIETKALLKSTQMTVLELAYYFNYADATSFGKFFRKQVGMTPKEYRNS